jgi:hypothetical protein
MTTKEKIELKIWSLGKWLWIKQELKSNNRNLSFLKGFFAQADCGYCSIYYPICRNCPLGSFGLCASGKGRAYNKVVRYRDNPDTEEAPLKAAITMITAIKKDLKKEGVKLGF